MGPKRKKESGAGAPTKRKRKTAITAPGDDDATLDTPKGGGGSSLNSDIEDEPQVEDIIKVDLEPEFNPLPLAVGNNQQQFLGELSIEVPNMDIGEVKLVEYPKEELLLQVEDEGCHDSNTVDVSKIANSFNGNPNAEEGLSTAACASTGSSPEGEANTEKSVNFVRTGERQNDEGQDNSDGSSNLDYWKLRAEEMANKKVESDKKSRDLETEMTKQRLELEKKSRELEAGQTYWKLKAEDLAMQKLELSKKARDLEAKLASQKLQSNKKLRDLETEMANQRLELEKKTRNLQACQVYWKLKTKELELSTNSKSERTNLNLKRGALHTTTSSSSSSKSKPGSTECEDLTPTRGNVSNEGDRTSNGSSEVNVHPLLDEKIMELVFQYIMRQPAKEDVLKDIKNFRQVNKPWRNAVTRVYRETAPILTFGSSHYDNKLGNTIYTFGNLKKFLETMKESEMIPFQSYEITGSLMTSENQKLMEDFLRICGPVMISVDFRFKQGGTFEGNFDLNGSPELDLSELKTLHVDVSDSCSDYIFQRHALVTFLQFVLNAAQSLREFKCNLTFPDYHIAEYHESPIENCANGICLRIPQCVKVLDLKMSLTDFAFNYLAENGFALEEFTLRDCHYKTAKPATIIRFLRNQSASLTTLRISTSLSCKFSNFPLFKKLEVLTLCDLDVIPFSLAEKSPNLICLDVGKCEKREMFVEFFSKYAGKTAPSVKKICMPTHFNIEPLLLTVQKFAEYFPNITELRLERPVRVVRPSYPYWSPAKTRDDEDNMSRVLENVFMHLSNLEVLQITFPTSIQTNLDSVFSGLFEEDCDFGRIRSKQKYVGQSDEKSVMVGMQFKANMLHMKKLRKLVLKMERDDQNNQTKDIDTMKYVTLTDFTVHFVFLELAELQELEVTSGFRLKGKISDEYLQRLKNKLHLKLESE